MGLFDSVKTFLTLDGVAPPPVQARAIDSFTDYPGLTQQIADAFGYGHRPWRPASVQDALGVPAIHRAVTLISNTGGALSMEAWRNGRKLEPEQRPSLIVRPDPFTTARDFYRDTLYSMATRGEAWWWVAKRDGDGNALSLLPVPAPEVMVTENQDDPRYPTIEWRGKKMRNADMRHITLLKEPGALRGFGPLQVCNAAVSISVESQEWAANFFASGGYPSIWIRAAGDLSGEPAGDPDVVDAPDWYSEVQRLKEQWISTAPNTPKVTDEGILDVKQFDPPAAGAQMLDARDHQNGDAARMFGIPGSLLDYRAGGSNLTYQNLEQEMTKFLRTCLIPNYLEPVEQAMSDLLTRSTVGRFHVDDVNRADIKTRWEVYEKAAIVLGPDEGAELARSEEGLVPGNVEVAPIPFAPPQAVPASLPVARTEIVQVACDGQRVRRRSGVTYLDRCRKLLAPTFTGECPRCRKVYGVAS